MQLILEYNNDKKAFQFKENRCIAKRCLEGGPKWTNLNKVT